MPRVPPLCGDANGIVSDFVPDGRDNFLPVLGIRVDPVDGSVWANSWTEETSRSELLHFGAHLTRWIDPLMKHGEEGMKEFEFVSADGRAVTEADATGAVQEQTTIIHAYDSVQAVKSSWNFWSSKFGF